MKTLLLVDGSSYLYRAFHALPDLRNKAGEPTGAVYGVLNMLRRLRKDIPSEYSACVFDAKGKTFRDDIYPEYKAHRPAMPDDLAAQIEPLLECIRATGWPLLIVDGVEADDVIGTLAKQAERAGMRTVVSTGDKDMAQLVNERVSLVNTMSNENLDPAGVRGKFGVPPERITDYLALVGDSVDNIPGVDKVGPKTAARWLSEYGSLDNLIAHAGEIGGLAGENLRSVRDWLPQARELLTIKCDVPLSQNVHDLAPLPPDHAKLATLFDRLDFKSWRRELETAGGDASTPTVGPPAISSASPRRYETVLDEDALRAWIAKLETAELASIDTETTSLDPMQAELVGISISVSPHEAAYIPFGHRGPAAPDQLPVQRALAMLQPWLANAAKPKVGQNLKFDLHVFANHGVSVRGIAHDTLLESYVIESHLSHDMDNLAERHLGVKTITYDEVTGKGNARIGFEQVAVDRATEYAAEDADVTLQLHRAMFASIREDAKLHRVYQDIEMPVLQVLFAMERHGVLIDAALLDRQSRDLGGRMRQIELDAYSAAGQPFNLNSPKQIQEILFEHQKLPVLKKTPGGTPSTDEDVLQQLALDYPLPKLLLDYRALSKLKSTYTDKLPRAVNPKTGRVHTTYGQAVAVTGRLSSNEPNLQNIPIRTAEGRRIREAFIAPAGSVIVSADYSQIELRIMAHLSGDEGLLKAFAERRDIHAATAAEVFGADPGAVSSEQRRYAKAINFGLIYGMSAFGLAAQLGLQRSAAQQYMERYFARYPSVAAYMERTRAEAKSRGYVETLFGRRLWLPEIKSGNPARRQGAERAAINAPMQGTAADLIKLAMIAVQGWIERERLSTRLIMQVHDELVLEVPDAEVETVRAELPGLMSGVATLAVPIPAEVGVGPNWERAH
ncbi:MAG: DNA polymerase I [Burkholderiales bacterium]